MTERPFVFGVAATGCNFTDREEETQRLLASFRNGINTVLISPRRWGKTSLVKRVCSLADSPILKTVYLDAFPCRDEAEFLTMFAKGVIRQTASRWEEWVTTVKKFLSGLSPRISMGPDPMTDFSLSLDFSQNTPGTDADQILNLPQKIAAEKGIRIVVCIDEFQQIGEFKNSISFQKRLRGAWQHQTHVAYCLFGSRRHRMNELFDDPSLPFYKFGDILHLQKIPTECWQQYIVSRFEAAGKHISPELASEICRKVDNHSSYVQQLAWLVLVHANKSNSITTAALKLALEDIIRQNTPLFERQTEGLTSSQLNLLKVVAKRGGNSLTTADNLRLYSLGTSANVVASRKALIRQELLDFSDGQLNVPDPVLALWLNQHF